MSFRADFLSSWEAGWTAPFSGSIQTWASDNVSLPPMYSIPGRFNAERSRFLIQPLDSMRNHSVRQVNICANTQGGKSLILELCIPYFILHSNGNLLCLHQTEAASNALVETRINPLLYSIGELSAVLPTEKTEKKKRLIRFPHLSLEFGGANDSNIHSRTIKHLFADEVWLYKKGYIQQAKERTTAYTSTRKILLTSQGGDVNDDWYNEFNSGQLFDWAWKCPHCGEFQAFEWDKQRSDKSWAGMIWDKVTDANGKRDIVKSAATCRLECFHCKGTVKDTPESREQLNKEGRYLLIKEGNPTVLSYHWNAMACPYIPWADLVIAYLQAKKSAEEHGDYEGLKDFYRQKLSRFWDMAITQTVANATVGQYDVNAEWPEESIRFLTVDVQDQLREFYVVVRAWDKKKNSRQLYRGIVHSVEDIRGIQEQFKVKDQHVALDCGAYASEVYATCVRHGHAGFLNGVKGQQWICWKALMGRSTDGFYHPDPNGKDKGIKRAFSTTSPGKPGEGVYAAKGCCPVIQWSNTAIKDLFSLCRSGKWGNGWEVLPDSPTSSLEDFEKQMKSERKVKERERKTGREIWIWKSFGANHYFDAECMNACLAHIHGIL